MKKAIVFTNMILALLLIVHPVFSQEIIVSHPQDITETIQSPIVSTDQSPDISSDETIIAKRGCCSWHGGVCGCDEASGMIRCCDGTLSPSCTCADY